MHYYNDYTTYMTPPIQPITPIMNTNNNKRKYQNERNKKFVKYLQEEMENNDEEIICEISSEGRQKRLQPNNDVMEEFGNIMKNNPNRFFP